MNSRDRDPITLDQADAMLSYISGVDDRDTWVKMGYILADEFGDAGFDIWDAWSQTGSTYNSKTARDVWKSCQRPSSSGSAATIGSLIKLAMESGFQFEKTERKPVDHAEIARRAADREARLAAEREQAAIEQAEAAEKAARMWADAAPAAHEYLDRKKVQILGARVLRGELLIPIRKGPGPLVGLQRIQSDGTKLFLRGTPMAGAYTVIGKPVRGGVVVIGEGWATCASVHLATGDCAVVAFNAGNLVAVAQKIRAAMPDAQIVLAADDDAFTAGNPGMRAANAAAASVGGTVVYPMWAGDRGEGTDFNDLHCTEGLDAVRSCFEDPQAPVDEQPEPDPERYNMPEQPYDDAPPPDDDRAPAALHDPIDIFAEFPVPPIARDMLPAAIADYAFDAGELVGVDPAMVAIPALVACAAALHDDIRIQPKRHETGWTESARLWCAVVGAPSVKKSPSIKRATRRLRKIDIDLHDQNALGQARYQEAFDAFKEDKKAAKKDGGPQPIAPEMPKNVRMVVEDITVEALSEVLKDNNRGVLVIRDELSGWFGSMDAYSGGKGGGSKDRSAWLESYNGGPRVQDRVMRGSVRIENWSCSMIGGIQPDAIRRIAQDMTDDGLMQRFMIVVGKNAPEHDRPEDTVAYSAFSKLVDHLYAVQGGGENVICLTDEAHVVRLRLNAYTTDLVEYPALPGGLRSHLGKWSGLFARLCLIYHAIECAGVRVHPLEYDVSGDTAERVERLMREYLLPHALAYYTDILGAAGDLEHSRWIAGHVLSRKLGTITHSDLMRAYRQWRGLDDWRRQRITQTLTDMGWLIPVGDERASKRGAHTWAVNPKVHGLFSEKAAVESEKRERIRNEIASMYTKT